MIMRDELLDWYDQNKRELPWRTDKPDPYHVLLSEFMLQQTTVGAVKPYYHEFLQKWPRINDFAVANQDEVLAAWAGLGYYSRARNLLKAAREIMQHGAFPQDVDALKKLPGVGEYTAAALAAIAFGVEVLPIDGNVKRVLARFHAIDDPIDKPSTALREAAKTWERGARPGDLAQAFMDLGSMICRPKNPNCAVCPLRQGCQALLKGRVAELPKRSPKRAKKRWNGHAYVLQTPQGIAFEKRPSGLLGDMLGLPSAMGETVAFEPPIEGAWQKAGEIEHIFTHIHLVMKVWYLKSKTPIASNRWVFLDQDEQENTASLWRKVLKTYRSSDDAA